MAANPQIAFTNMENTPRTGVFRCLVPWSTGEMPNLATLQASRQVEFDQVNRDTYWSTFGPSHRDGSVRWSVAEFEATIPGGAFTRVQPDIVATVVSGANATPSPDFSEFDAYWADFEVSCSYTDPRNGQSYSIDLLSIARAGTNNATYSETTVGMRKIIRAEAYFGRGSHYELERAGGFDTNSAVVQTQGNLHARLWFEVSSGQRWGHGVLQFVADAQYPHPAQPPDGGARVASDHGRPTRLDPAVGEELTDPLTFEFQDGIQVQFRDVNTASAQYTSTRLWFVQNPDSGTSCWGDHPLVDVPTRRTFRLGLYALGDMQGWPVRFSTSWECQTQATWVDAVEKALRPYTYIGIPTHDTWMDTRRTAYLPAPYDSDQLSVKGGLEVPLVEVPQSARDTWYAEGPTRHLALLSQQHGVLSWRNPPQIYGRTWEWQTLGRQVNPPGTGAQAQLGLFREGRMLLAASVWDLVINASHTTREIGGARQGMLWQQEDHPTLWDGVDLTASFYISGTDWREHYGTRDSKGRFRGYAGIERYREQGAGSRYNGTLAAFWNPTWAGLTAFERDTQTWNPWDAAHFGMRQSFLHVLLTQDQFLSDMMQYTAAITGQRMIPRNYYGRNPGDTLMRGEARGVVRCNYHAWLISGDSRFRTLVANRMTQYVSGSVGQNVAFHRWNPWPLLAYNDPNQGENSSVLCDGPSATRTHQNPVFVAWQVAHHVVFCLNAAMEWADDIPTEATTLARQAYEGIRTIVDKCFLAAPGALSVGATQEIDTCWGNVIAFQTAAGQTGIVAALQNAGYGVGKLYWVDTANDDAWSIYDDITRETVSINPSNAGQANNHHAALLAYEIFASLRADPNFVERAEYFIARLTAWRQMDWTEYDENGTSGYASDRWVTSGFAPPAPAFSATPRQGLAPLEVAFDGSASSVGGDRSASIWRWWFDYDGNPASTPDLEAQLASSPGIETPTRTYEAGDYRVRLEIEDSSGQTNSLDIASFVRVSAEIGAAPAPDFRSDRTVGVAPLRLEIYDRTSPAPLTWLWTVTSPNGDVLTSSEQDPTFILESVGDYDVALTAESAWGTGYAERLGYATVTGPALPRADFSISPTTGTVPLDITVTDASENASTWLWSWGDGITSEGQAPGAHTYNVSTTYTITLTVWNAEGDVDEKSIQFYAGSVAVEAGISVGMETLQAMSRLYDPTVDSQTGGTTVEPDLVVASAEVFDASATGIGNATIVFADDVEFPLTAAAALLALVVVSDENEVAVSLQTATAAVYDADVTNEGPVDVLLDLLTTSAALEDPTVGEGAGTTESLGLQSVAVVQFDVTPSGDALADGTSLQVASVTVYDASVASGQNADTLLDLQTAAAAVYSPTVGESRTEEVTLLSVIGELFDPSVLTDQSLSPALLTAASILLDPTVSVVAHRTETPDLLTATATVHDADVNSQGNLDVLLDVQAATASLLSPTVGQGSGQTVTPSLLQVTASLPAVDAIGGQPVTVELDALSAVASVYAATAAGLRNVSITPQVQVAAASVGDVDVTAGVRALVRLDQASATVLLLTPTVRANQSDNRDESELTGSIARVAHLEGTV